MAAILRSSVIQTARRAFSGEGILSVRALQTGCKVDPLFKKTDGIARKKSVVGCTKRYRMKTNDLGATPWLIGGFITLAFLQGIESGQRDAHAERMNDC